jgi:glycosyltransferase involved in cell wall biosynthesis
MASPRVSVVIPVYNGERYLEDTLRSVLSQTYRPMEVIAVNDGSTDHTQQILERFAREDERLRVVGTENRGLALARNRGIEESTGELVAFIDADDLWHREKIARQVAAMTRVSTDPLGFVYAYTRFIDEHGYWLADGLSVPLEGFVLEPHLLTNFVGSGGSNLLCRRDALIAVGKFRATIVAGLPGRCEDYDLQLDLAARYKVGLVPEYLVAYRRYPGSMSSQVKQMADSRRAVVERHLAEVVVSAECRTWALSALDVVEVGAAIAARNYRAAARVLWRLGRYDPLRAISEILWRVRQALRKRRRATLGASTPVTFDELDPRVPLSPPEPRVLSPLMNRRLLALCAASVRRSP